LRAQDCPAVVLEFPENREFNREFLQFCDYFDPSGADFRSHFNALQANSLLSARGEIASQFQCVAGKFPDPQRTGNFFALTGNLVAVTGNSISLIDFGGILKTARKVKTERPRQGRRIAAPYQPV
jgi:hypothetical protein